MKTTKAERQSYAATMQEVEHFVTDAMLRGRQRGALAFELVTQAMAIMFRIPVDEARKLSVGYWEAVTRSIEEGEQKTAQQVVASVLPFLPPGNSA